MSITISGHTFEGPYSSTASLEDRSGVYAVFRRSDSSYVLLDIGESATVKSRVENHDRAACWQRNSNGSKLYYAVHYTPGQQQSGRQEIEQRIRHDLKPPCGDR